MGYCKTTETIKSAIIKACRQYLNEQCVGAILHSILVDVQDLMTDEQLAQAAQPNAPSAEESCTGRVPGIDYRAETLSIRLSSIGAHRCEQSKGQTTRHQDTSKTP